MKYNEKLSYNNSNDCVNKNKTISNIKDNILNNIMNNNNTDNNDNEKDDNNNKIYYLTLINNNNKKDAINKNNIKDKFNYQLEKFFNDKEINGENNKIILMEILYFIMDTNSIITKENI